jgi:hypothetical protein
MQVQELEQGVGFCFLELGKASAVGEVHVQGFKAGHRVCANGGMVSIDWGTVGRVVVVVLGKRISYFLSEFASTESLSSQ